MTPLVVKLVDTALSDTVTQKLVHWRANATFYGNRASVLGDSTLH